MTFHFFRVTLVKPRGKMEFPPYCTQQKATLIVCAGQYIGPLHNRKSIRQHCTVRGKTAINVLFIDIVFMYGRFDFCAFLYYATE